jgi:hypothetical protein
MLSPRCVMIFKMGVKNLFRAYSERCNELPFAALDLEDAIMETDRKEMEREREEKEA